MSVKERIDLDRIPVDDSIGPLRHLYPGNCDLAYCGHRARPGERDLKPYHPSFPWARRVCATCRAHGDEWLRQRGRL